MAIVIIPHLRSIPRWLGRLQLLTRCSRLPVSLCRAKNPQLLMPSVFNFLHKE
jgi:hypothetical protein